MPNYEKLRLRFFWNRRNEISTIIQHMVTALNADLEERPLPNTTLKAKRRALLEDVLKGLTQSLEAKYPLSREEINQVRMAIYTTSIMDGANVRWGHRRQNVKKYCDIWRNRSALHWQAAGSRRYRRHAHGRFS